MRPQQTPAHGDGDPARHKILVSEIAGLEARLARSDHSTYEKSLIRSYEQLIMTRRAELAADVVAR